MLSALIVLLGVWFLLLLTSLALPLTMGGVWWRPEPCRCLGVDASVPVPACSHISGWVRVVSAAFCLGSSVFFVTSGLLCFRRLPVSLFQWFPLISIVVLAQWWCYSSILLLMFTAEDIFWAEILLYGYSSLGVELDIRLSGPSRYATGKLRLCAYSVVTGFSHLASGGIFCAVSNGLIVLVPCLELDSAFAYASQGSCDPPTQYPISPWPSACGGVG